MNKTIFLIKAEDLVLIWELEKKIWNLEKKQIILNKDQGILQNLI